MTQVFTSASMKGLKVKKKGTRINSFITYLTIAYDSFLRERKNAIVKLLDVVGLKPQAGADLRVEYPDTIMREEALRATLGRPVKKVKEIVGDGEEIELEDAEVLSDNDIDAIYQKLVQLLISLASLLTDFLPGLSAMIGVWVKWNLLLHSISRCADIKSKPYCLFHY